MKMKSRQVLLACAALALCMGSAGARADDDDCNAGTSLRLVNGRIHTMDEHDTHTSRACSSSNGRFAAVGGGGQPEAGDCARDDQPAAAAPSCRASSTTTTTSSCSACGRARDARLENAQLDRRGARHARRARAKRSRKRANGSPPSAVSPAASSTPRPARDAHSRRMQELDGSDAEPPGVHHGRLQRAGGPSTRWARRSW